MRREGQGGHFFLMFLSGYLIVALGDEQGNRNIALVNLFAMFFDGCFSMGFGEFELAKLPILIIYHLV